MEKKSDLSDSEHDTVVRAKWSFLSVSQTADILGISRTHISRVYRECSEKEENIQ